MLTVDLNCDLGEGCGNDAELMQLISSANIACGYHAGDNDTMRRTVELAIAGRVAIGAHPGYADRTDFGRRPMSLASEDVHKLIAEQLHALRVVCSDCGVKLHHVKPHGALYNQAATDRGLAAAIAESIARFDRDLAVYGLSGSFLISESESMGLKTVSEVFADRTYRADGTLTPRTGSNALITDRAESLAQVLQMIESGTVTATTGERVPIQADTICIHGDGANAVEFVRAIRNALEMAGVRIESPSRIGSRSE